MSEPVLRWPGITPDGENSVMIRRNFGLIDAYLRGLNTALTLDQIEGGSSIAIGPAVSTQYALPRWGNALGNSLLNSTILAEASVASSLGIAADDDLVVFGNAVLTVNGAVTASGAVTGSNLAIANWDDAYTKRVNTWNSPLTFAGNAASVTSANLAGTSNQVVLSASGVGVLLGSTNITLSLPQSIDTAAAVQFGRLGLGVAAPASNVGSLLIDASFTDITGSRQSLSVIPDHTLSADNGNRFTGVSAVVDINPAGFNATAGMGIVAVYGIGRNVGTGVVTGIAGLRARVDNTSTGTLTNAYGLYIDTALNSGGGSVGTAYGIYIATQTVGTTKWQLHAAGTQDSAFGGPLAVGSVTAPVASALLEMTSTSRGFLGPRMTTTQRTNISSPAEGLQVYDLTLHLPYIYNGTTWVSM